jgi:hypothetical protein
MHKEDVEILQEIGMILVAFGLFLLIILRKVQP